MQAMPKPTCQTSPGIYRHYKGGLYRVLFVGLESTNDRPRCRMVVYVSLDLGGINIRQEREFHEWIFTEDKGAIPRFALYGEAAA